MLICTMIFGLTNGLYTTKYCLDILNVSDASQKSVGFWIGFAINIGCTIGSILAYGFFGYWLFKYI